MIEQERQEIVEASLASEYSRIWGWEPIPIPYSYGPDDSEYIDEFARRVKNMRQASIEALIDLPDDELIKMKLFKRGRTDISIWPWAELLPENPNSLVDVLPSPIAYGFGHPSFQPDFSYWVLMPRLSLHEATLLSVGAGPDFMSSDELSKLRLKRRERSWAASKFLSERHDLLSRVFPSGGSGNTYMRTANLFNWIEETRLGVHPGFKAALDARFKTAPAPMPPKEATGAEKESMLKLIAAMAVEQYSYNPKASKNDAIKNISDDLDGLGLSLDRKTIRKWMKEACELIDPEHLPK